MFQIAKQEASKSTRALPEVVNINSSILERKLQLNLNLFKITATALTIMYTAYLEFTKVSKNENQDNQDALLVVLLEFCVVVILMFKVNVQDLLYHSGTGFSFPN